MQQKKDRFILIIPASSRFFPLVRQAVNALVHEHDTSSSRIYELQLAVNEACNLVAHIYTDRGSVKAVSITALLEGDQAHITIDDGADSQAGSKARKDIIRRKLPLEGNLALKTVRRLCDHVSLSSGITGGLRIELKKTLDITPLAEGTRQKAGEYGYHDQLDGGRQSPV